MSEETMIADGEPEPGEEPHREKQADLDSPDGPIKQQTQRDQRTHKRQYVENDEMPPLQLVKVPASDDSTIAHFLRNLQIKSDFYQQIIELASLFAGRQATLLVGIAGDQASHIRGKILKAAIGICCFCLCKQRGRKSAATDGGWKKRSNVRSTRPSAFRLVAR